MTTSGSVDFNATRNQIIRQAALDLGAISAGVTMGGEMLSDFDFRLNAMVKRWNATDLHVWTVAEATLFPQSEQVKYALGPSSADHATQSYVRTTISAAEASGQTVLSVTSITGISANDNIGIEVDDGTIHWSTVSGAPSGGTVTIAAALDDSAAKGKNVFAYTTKIGRPLKIVAARRYDPDTARDVPITMAARLDYRALNDKTGTGIVNQVFYDPQLTTGYLYLWYAPLAVS